MDHCEYSGIWRLNKQRDLPTNSDYINAHFDACLQEELKSKHTVFKYHNRHIHVSLDFISPTRHSLNTPDLLTIKSLDNKMNMMPVIAKTNSMSNIKLQKFKIELLSELVGNGLRICQFPTDDETIAKIKASVNDNCYLL